MSWLFWSDILPTGMHMHFITFLGLVVLFDANVSLYLVIGCGGFESKTQPRYSGRASAKEL